MHWSRGWSCTDHVTDHALITWLIMHWSRGYHALMTWLIMHLSYDWSCPDHVAILHSSLGWSYTHLGTDRALIKVLSCIDYMTPHALITWMIIHWSCDRHCSDHVAIMHCSRGWSCTVHVATMYWSRDWSCSDHVFDNALITWLIMHWSRGWSCTDTVTEHGLITWLSCSDHVT